MQSTPTLEQKANPVATAHLGAAVVALRQRAQGQMSGSHTRRLLALADGIETLLPAIERLEMVCEANK
jgi:hypothetical protein